MKLPRNLSGRELAHALAALGYQPVHERGSHIRLTTEVPAEHHITIPDHDHLKVGTMDAILRDVAHHAGLDHEALVERLFGS